MSSRKEVRFLDGKGTPSRPLSSIQNTPPASVNAHRSIVGKNPKLVASRMSKQQVKNTKPVPPPPPPRKRTPTPPPVRKQSPTPPPPTTPHLKSAVLPVKAKAAPPPPPPPPTRQKSAVLPVKTKATPPPTPPPPPPPKPALAKPVAERHDTIERTPAKSQLQNHQIQYFSPCETETEDLQNNVFLEAPALTILSPMSGVTNMTDLYSRSPSLSTHRRRGTNALDTTLNSIDMLNFDYIENCDCPPALQRVIRLLSESKNHSPNLLKAAMKKLTVVQQQDAVSKLTQTPSILSPTAVRKNVGSPIRSDDLEGAANLSRITTLNTTLDSIDGGKSSLNFSLSPSSTLQGVELIETPKIREYDFFNTMRSGIDRHLGPIMESPLNSKQRPELPKHSSPSHYSTPGSIGSQRIQSLKKIANESSSEKKKLLDEIRKVTRENEETKKTLDMARATLCKKDEETRAVEERLEAKITELSQVLANTAARSKLVVEGERTYRKQCEEELIKENKKNQQLNEELKETRDNLEKLQRRHSSFRIELLKVTGFNKTERKNLSQRQFLTSLAEKIETMKANNDRMSRTLKQANQAIQERDVMEMQLSDALETKDRLVIENQKLSTKIQELRAEVKSSRAYIDKLLRTSNDTREEDWEKHEQQYKQVIQNLRKQIRKQDAVISIDLYKAEKDRVREKVTQLQVAESTINGLTAKVAELEGEKALLADTKQSPCIARDRYTAEQNVQTPKSASKAVHTPKSKVHFQTDLEKNGADKKKDDLTGITITFQTSPQSTKTRSPRSGESYQRQLGVKQTKSNGAPNEKTSNVLREITVNGNTSVQQTGFNTKKPFNVTKKINTGNDFFDRYLGPCDANKNTGKENAIAPKSSFSGSQIPQVRDPMERSALKKVKDLGGRSALRNKIKKMRSPKLSRSPVMPRQVHVNLY